MAKLGLRACLNRPERKSKTKRRRFLPVNIMGMVSLANVIQINQINQKKQLNLFGLKKEDCDTHHGCTAGEVLKYVLLQEMKATR